MIADLKPYAEYKESGLPWLGQVPGHWEMWQIATLGSERRASSAEGRCDYRPVSLTKRRIVYDTIHFDRKGQ